ncbi:hypothetical protein ACPZ19_51525, partial [Amycolatopsis lurida]
MRPDRMIAWLTAVALVFFVAWKLVSAPDTYRDVLDERAVQFQAIRDTFTRIADALPPPRRPADGACLALADLRYSTDHSLARDNNAVFVMENQLRQPEVRLAFSEFDLLVGPNTANLVLYFHELGPEPVLDLNREHDGDFLDDFADDLDVALNVDYVVVSRVVDYRPEASRRLGQPIDPARVSLETFVIRATTGETVCAVQAGATEEGDYTCTTISPRQPGKGRASRREASVDAISPDLAAL